jgi:4-oxalocrotonate tautomerase
MPVVDVTLIEGRTRAEKEAMYAAVTEALVSTVGCEASQVRIKVNEIAAVDYAIAGVSALSRQEQEQETGKPRPD